LAIIAFFHEVLFYRAMKFSFIALLGMTDCFISLLKVSYRVCQIGIIIEHADITGKLFNKSFEQNRIKIAFLIHLKSSE
jgi:hypothetical protein